MRPKPHIFKQRGEWFVDLDRDTPMLLWWGRSLYEVKVQWQYVMEAKEALEWLHGNA
jgi:hypothetical protein